MLVYDSNIIKVAKLITTPNVINKNPRVDAILPLVDTIVGGLMSIIGYFEEGVKRYLSMDKYTTKIKKEMKEMLIQYDTALNNNELGDDIFRIKLLQDNINKIKRGL